MTYKPTGRNVVQPSVILIVFRLKNVGVEWEVMARPEKFWVWNCGATANKSIIALTATRWCTNERHDQVSKEMASTFKLIKSKIDQFGGTLISARTPRIQLQGRSLDLKKLVLYVKANNWLQVNQDWGNIIGPDSLGKIQ